MHANTMRIRDGLDRELDVVKVPVHQHIDGKVVESMHVEVYHANATRTPGNMVAWFGSVAAFVETFSEATSTNF